MSDSRIAGVVLRILECHSVDVPSDRSKSLGLLTGRGSHDNQLSDLDEPQRNRVDRRYTILKYTDQSQAGHSRGC